MEDIQGILERINREGVEKAEAEAKRIVAEAEAKAKALLAAARDEATQAKAEAVREADAAAARANETIRQAARDVVLVVKDALTALLENLLVKDVDRALADERLAAELAAAAIKDLVGPGEIACAPKIAAALKARLAAKGDFTLAADETLKGGFTVHLSGGRVEHAYTADVIAGEIAKRLRPELAKLLK